MIAIVGAGITGLTLGMLLKKQGIPFIILEASDKPGGNIQTLDQGPYRLESGPNSLQLNNNMYRWLEDLQLEKEIVMSLPSAKNRYILKQGRYRKLPKSPLYLLSNRTLSWKAKKAIWNEPKQTSLSPEQETIDSFFRRRLGDEITDYVVHPFISGIYAGNPNKLLIGAAFPKLLSFEKKEGSLIKGMVRSRKKQTHKGIFSFNKGLSVAIHRMADVLESDIHYKATVSKLFASQPIHLSLEEGTGIDASQVVLCVPAHKAADVLSEAYSDISQDLTQVFYPHVSVVFSAYKKKHIRHSLMGFGALHNHLEPSNTLGTIFTSSVFPNRCPADEVLLTTFIGGALYPDWAEKEEADILEAVKQDHQRFLGAKQEPVFQHLVRWEKAIPQYEESVLPAWTHEALLQQHGIRLGGNWIGGISVGSCVERAYELAEAINLSQ